MQSNFSLPIMWTKRNISRLSWWNAGNESWIKKEVIAVDIDEVLYPFLREFIIDHNLKFKTNLSIANFSSYEFEDTLKMDRRKSVQRVYDFLSKTDQINPEPIKDSKEAIVKLSKFYDLVVITSRYSKYQDQTVQWLNLVYSKDNLRIIFH